jgi:hypothetical protein
MGRIIDCYLKALKVTLIGWGVRNKILLGEISKEEMDEIKRNLE